MDAAGKIGSGIARGHLLSTGAFTECKTVNIFSTSLNRTIQGDYYRYSNPTPTKNFESDSESSLTSKCNQTPSMAPVNFHKSEWISVYRTLVGMRIWPITLEQVEFIRDSRPPLFFQPSEWTKSSRQCVVFEMSTAGFQMPPQGLM